MDSQEDVIIELSKFYELLSNDTSDYSIEKTRLLHKTFTLITEKLLGIYPKLYKVLLKTLNNTARERIVTFKSYRDVWKSVDDGTLVQGMVIFLDFKLDKVRIDQVKYSMYTLPKNKHTRLRDNSRLSRENADGSTHYIHTSTFIDNLREIYIEAIDVD